MAFRIFVRCLRSYAVKPFPRVGRVVSLASSGYDQCGVRLVSPTLILAYGFIMSVVKFLCPNGHPLNAPRNFVGKAGKCPKCNTAFVVPAPDSDESPYPTLLPPTGGSSNKLTSVTGSSPQLQIHLGSGIREGNPSGVRPPQEVFVFLCPNGHKLNGPPSLKGKLGQCPHCGAKFRIPEDEPEEVDEAELVRLASPGAAEVEEISSGDLQPVESEPPFEEGVHPLASIMNRLWIHKGETGEIELLLPEGEIMHPEHFSPALSSNDYGVFATREGMGYSLSVIPWESVRRVNVHKLDQLPPGAFPES